MTAAMRHRGPDEEGFLFGEPRAPGLALGMRRLSIIDLAGGHQPIWNETKDVAVVFNGELYGYRELRDRLILCGHRFTTQSDTEILVHAWEEWGEDALNEAAHALLFGMTMGGRMVENPDSERYSSPLRADPRPMDGVVHATYVIARVMHCLDCLLQADCLTDLERKEIMETLQVGMQRYREGIRTTQTHAHFTEPGRLAFQRCIEEYPPH